LGTSIEEGTMKKGSWWLTGVLAISAFMHSIPVAAQQVSYVPTTTIPVGTDTAGVADRLSLRPSAVILLASSEAVRAQPAPPRLDAAAVSGRGTALAIVGGALFVGGLVAGGDAGTAMIVVGAGVGAYGLYLMLSR
jgi:hypothetical protein